MCEGIDSLCTIGAKILKQDRSTLNITIITVGNKICDQSSNPGKSCSISLCTNVDEKGMNPSLFPLL